MYQCNHNIKDSTTSHRHSSNNRHTSMLTNNTPNFNHNNIIHMHQLNRNSSNNGFIKILANNTPNSNNHLNNSPMD